MIRGDEVRDRGSCKSKRHLGVDFVIWTLENAWFWLVLHPHGTCGMIGATTNEARAMREVCLSVEGTSSLANAILARNGRCVGSNLRLAQELKSLRGWPL